MLERPETASLILTQWDFSGSYSALTPSFWDCPGRSRDDGFQRVKNYNPFIIITILKVNTPSG